MIKKKSFVFHCFIIFSFLIFPRGVSAQTTMERLLSAKVLKCHFRDASLGEWRDPDAKVSRWFGEKESVLVFYSINLESGKAKREDKNGPVDVAVFQTKDGLTFVEVAPSGSVMMTTIFDVYYEKINRFAVVHSRHVSIAGEPMPAQYYGMCEVSDYLEVNPY